MALRKLRCADTLWARKNDVQCDVTVFFAEKPTGGFVCLEAQPQPDGEWALNAKGEAVYMKGRVPDTTVGTDRFRNHTQFHRGGRKKDGPQADQMNLDDAA